MGSIFRVGRLLARHPFLPVALLLAYTALDYHREPAFPLADGQGKRCAKAFGLI